MVKWPIVWRALAINTLMVLSENSESIIISWSVWMKQGAEEEIVAQKKLKLIPQFSSISFMFLQILKPVWEPSISLQCKYWCLYSELLFNQCVDKKIYDVFVFEFVHMSVVNDKNEASDNSVCTFIFKLSWSLRKHCISAVLSTWNQVTWL